MPVSITDCDHYCARCGEHLAECSLCEGLPHAVVYRPGPSYAEINEAEREIDMQSRAIRRGADARRRGLLS